jgi:hypothetical protein
MAVRIVTFIYIGIVVVLMYSIDKERMKQYQGEIQPSDWLELSENWGARTNSHLAALQVCTLSQA